MSNLTKVTLDTFIAWKKKKMRERRQAQRENDKSKLASFKSGKQVGWCYFYVLIIYIQTGLSGRDLFTFNPDLIAEQNAGDDGEPNEVAYYEKELEEKEEVIILFGVNILHMYFTLFFIWCVKGERKNRQSRTNVGLNREGCLKLT